MRQSLIAGTTAAVLFLTSGAAALAGSFNPDPTGQYEVLRSVGETSVAQEESFFERIMAGGNLCAPQLYVDTAQDGTLDVTLLSSCHTGQQVTLTYNDKPTNTRMSYNGAAFVTLEHPEKITLVRAEFADGTQVQTAVIRATPRFFMASNG